MITPMNKNKNHKTHKTHKNKTQKNKIKYDCSNGFESFEKGVEDLFKKNKVDFNSANYNLQKQIIKDLKKAVNVSNIKPQNDFYSYVNDRWIDSYKRQAGNEYLAQLDDFRIVQDKVYHELLEIVNNYITNPETKNTNLGICIKKFYQSQIKWNTDKESTDDALAYLNEIDVLRQDKNNLWKLLGKLNENEIISYGSPICWTLNPNDKNPDTYKTYIVPPQLSLINADMYLTTGNDAKKYKSYIDIYLKYLKDLFAHTFGKNNEFNVHDIFKCESKLAKAFDYDKFNEDPDGYNLVTTSEAMKLLNFDWTKFSQALGYKTPPSDFVLSSVNYTAAVTEMLLNEWDNKEWRTYFIYIYIRQQQRTNEEGNQICVNFNGKYVLGLDQGIDIKLRAVFGLGFAFSSFLNNEYIDKYENIKIACYVKSMAEDLKTVFIRILKRNTWLQPHTKQMAIKKLEHFEMNIGSKKYSVNDVLLNYNNNDQWGNMVMTAKNRHIFAVNLEGKKTQTDMSPIDWAQFPPKFVGKQSYIVNAMYTPTENAIDIPLAYLQPPFVDLQERGIEYNLTRVGFTIAHEMSHSLDDWGSRYDYEGKLNNWWTPKDEKSFKLIQKDVIKQYEAFALYDGIVFDASSSIGEDLADISGLNICVEYLRDFQLKNRDNLSIVRLSFETFFIYFADQSRQKINKKAIQAQLKTNPHPLDKYRCNVPLSRIPVFRVIYKITKKDKMWWHSTTRVWEK